MKIFSLVLIIVISLMWAILTVKQIKNHTVAVRQCVMMLESIEMLMEHRSLSIDNIFEYLNLKCNYRNLNFIGFINNRITTEKNYDIVFHDAFSDSKNIKYFDAEDIDFLRGYFSLIGKSDLTGQISNCRLYKDFFNKKLQKLEKEEASKCKSMSTLIMGIGALLIIVVI